MSSLFYRIRKLQKRLKKNSAVFLCNPFNVYYFSGMKSSQAYIIADQSQAYYFTDFRYLQKAQQEIQHLTVHNIKENGIQEFVERQAYSTLYFENDLPYNRYAQLNKMDLSLLPGGNIVQEIRMQKEPGELILMTESIQGVSWAFHSLVEYLKLGTYQGLSEWDIVKFLRRRLEELDWPDFSFSPIVAFDENASIPHYSHSRNKVLGEKSFLILVDFGFYHHHYASDFTRVIFLQQPSAELQHCYKILQDAFTLFEEQFSSLSTMADIDLLFRSIIKEAGYGEYFQHATGHNIGLECHEYPPVSAFSEVNIRDNMVFTIEPGIYLPGKGGIRIEDMYTVEKGKLLKLTPYTREMCII